MDWPQINIAASSLLVAALCILASLILSVRRREEQALVDNPLPRFILLQEFYNTLPSLPFLYEGEEWGHFHEKIKRVLKMIQLAAGDKQQDDLRLTKSFTTAFDGDLLGYLQSQPELAEMLQEYLPTPGQSWATFLHGKEEQYSDLESDSQLFHASEKKRVEALGWVQVLVDSFLDDLELIDSAISDATRGDTRSTSKRGISKIQVYYATDRAVTADGEYTEKRSNRDGLHYGYMVVGIPGGDRNPGQKADPGKKEEADPLKHIVIFNVVTLLPECKDRDDKEGFRTSLRQSSENALLLYIHGFNTTHKSAIKTAARLKHDLEFKGQIIVYSWSSCGSIYAYVQDGHQIKETVVHLQDFIKTILNISGISDVHIVAHSMGNRALIEALRNIYNRGVQPTLKNVVFVAADETREKFDDMVCKLQTNNPGVQHEQQRSDVSTRTPQLTVYSSTMDAALSISKFCHNMEDRLGSTYSFLNKVKQDEGSDQIDVSGPKITKSWLHHSYHVQVPKVLQDIGDLLSTNYDARRRSERIEPLITRVSYENKDLVEFFAFDTDFWKVPQRCL